MIIKNVSQLLLFQAVIFCLILIELSIHIFIINIIILIVLIIGFIYMLHASYKLCEQIKE